MRKCCYCVLAWSTKKEKKRYSRLFYLPLVPFMCWHYVYLWEKKRRWDRMNERKKENRI
jgi:hypothetical protein